MSKPNSGNIGSYLTSLFGKPSTTKKTSAAATPKKKTSQIEVAKASSSSSSSGDVNNDISEVSHSEVFDDESQVHHIMEDDEIVEQHAKKVVLMTTQQQLQSAHTIVNWKDRENQGKILVDFGSDIDNITSEKDVKIVKPTKSGTVKYMYDKLYKQSSVLLERLEDVGAKILEYHGIDSAKPLNYHSDQPEVYIGRILAESVTGDDKLNPSSILFEGLSSAETSDCKVVKLSFDKFGLDTGVSQTLFPGQVVAIRGLNSVQGLKVEKIYTGAPLDAPQDQPPPSNEKKKIQIMVACGPFTLQHNVLYNPLQNLISLVETNEPNVLVLIGPFLSEDNALVKSGFMDETFESTFENRFIAKLKTIETDCRVVLIPSLKDVNSDFVFPQPAIQIENGSSKIECFPNPSTFSITSPSFNPIKIGVTSIDTIKSIKEKEYTFGYVEDQTEHYLKSVLEQQYYYPRLIPSPEIPLDHSLVNGVKTSLKIEESPNIIILPSDQLESCCKVIGNTIVVNPTRLCDNHNRKEGSYAIIDIMNDTSLTLDKRVHVQVVNI